MAGASLLHTLQLRAEHAAWCRVLSGTVARSQRLAAAIRGQGARTPSAPGVQLHALSAEPPPAHRRWPSALPPGCGRGSELLDVHVSMPMGAQEPPNTVRRARMSSARSASPAIKGLPGTLFELAASKYFSNWLFYPKPSKPRQGVPHSLSPCASVSQPRALLALVRSLPVPQLTEPCSAWCQALP